MTRKKFEPRAYTGMTLDFMASTPRCMLLARMGMGKTVLCATLLDLYYNLAGQTEPTLIVAPKNVATVTWPEELAKWEHLRGLEASVIHGTPAERLKAMRRDVPLHITTYDLAPWFVSQFPSRNLPYRRVIADESTRVKNFRLRQGSVQARALGTIAHKPSVREWINLTGTPAPNGLKDLWGQMWFIDKGQRLGYSYDGFQSRWFAYKRIRDAVSHRVDIKTVIMPYAQEQIQAALSDVCLTLDPKDWFDLRKPIVTPVYVTLPAKARRHYDELEKDLFTHFSGADIEAVGEASKTLKCLQCANGAIYLDKTATSWGELHDAKLQALESIYEEAAGTPVLVAYHFKSDLARIQRAFPFARVMDGKPATVRSWNAGEIPMLLSHPASAGHGLNLQEGGNILVFFGHWWDLEKHDQIIERIGPMRQFQAGQDREVFIYYIVAHDTMDEVVLDRHVSKRSVQEAFLNYMKRRKREVQIQPRLGAAS